MRRLGTVEVVGVDVVEDRCGEKVGGVGAGRKKGTDLSRAGGVVQACKYMNALELGGG
jgi:hypothetical protein